MANWWDDLRPQEAQSAPSGNWWDDLEPVNRKPFGYREESPDDWDGPVMEPASMRRSFSEFIADQKRALGSGVAMGASGLARLPVDAWNAAVQYSPLRMALPDRAGAAVQNALHVEQPQFVKSLSANLEAAGERERHGMSSGQQAQAERFEHVDGAWDTAKFLATNPAYLATQGTEVAGQMAPGGMGTKGLSAFSRLMRGAKVETGVNAALQSGMAGSLNQQDVQQALEAMPVSELRKHEDFERLKMMLETDDDEVVKDWLIRNNGSNAFAQSFAVNLATSLLTPHGTTIESAMLGNAGKAGSSRLRNAALGAAGEAVSEGLAETGEQVSQNINTYSPWSEGVGKAGVLGSVLGAGMGGVAGAAQTPDVKPSPQPLRDGDDLLSGGNSLDAQGEAIRQQQSKDESALDASLDAMFAPEPADTDAMQPAELPIMEGRTWERDLAGITQDADAARAQEQKERELDAIWRESQLPVSLDRAEEADAIRAATGQDMEAPTAMQFAFQQAREKKAAQQSIAQPEPETFNDPPEGAALRKRWNEDFDGAEQEYSALTGEFDSRGGVVLNTDLARELSPEYRANRGKSANVHEASSDFIKALYAKKLAQPTPEGKDPVVLFTAGGTGAGKTTGEKKIAAAGAIGSPEIIYDTNMNKMASSEKKIEQALKAGRKIEILYTYRDPVDALVHGALPRAMRMAEQQGTGRTVPLAEHAKTHLGAYSTIKALREKYENDDRVAFKYIDNSRGKGNEQIVRFADLPILEYNSTHGHTNQRSGVSSDPAGASRGDSLEAGQSVTDEHGTGDPTSERSGSLGTRLQAALDAEYAAGRISAAVYEGFAGRKPNKKLEGLRQQSTPENSGPVMQNRDRSRVASVAQMQAIKKNPDPERLGFSRDPNTGAPMVGEGAAIPDSDKGRADAVVMASGRRVPVRYAVVEADSLAASHSADGHANPDYEAAPLKALNNGRVAGLQSAWQAGNAKTYRDGIIADAALHGVSAEAVTSKRQPVLVRLYDPALNTGDMGAESNASAQLGLSPVEQAQTDARALPDLGGITWADDGTISPAQNVTFFRGFFRNLGAAQSATLQDSRGMPNAAALQRVRAAMVHRAYGDERLLSALAEDVNPDNRNIVHALVRAAAGFAALEQNDPLTNDLREAVTGALETVRDATRRGLSVDDAVAQGDLLGRNPAADAIARFMAASARSVRRMAEAFNAMAEYADAAQRQASHEDIFGDAPSPSVRQAIIAANKALSETYGRESQIAVPDTVTAEPGDSASERAGRGRTPAGPDPDSGGLELTSKSVQPEPARAVSAKQDGLFAAPTQREILDAEIARRDAERNGRTGSGSTDMLAGDGNLFATRGDQVAPAQADIEDAAQDAALVYKPDGAPYPTERAATAALNGNRLNGVPHEVVPVDGGFALRPAKKQDVGAPKKTDRSQPQRSSLGGERNETGSGIPSGLKAERSRDTDDLADRINRDLRRHGEPEGFKALSVPQDQLPDALSRALRVFERITGTRVVIFRNQTPGVVHFNGVNFRDGRVFVAEDSQFPLTLTAAHEWLHNIRRTNPELYEELVKEVRRQGRLPEYKQQLKKDGEPRWQSDDVVEEELTAAAVSDALTDPVFLQRLAERRRGSFRRIARAFLDFLNTLTKGWRDQGSNRYLKDVEAFRDKLAEVLEAFEKHNADMPGSADVRALFQRVFDGGTNAGVATNEPVAGTQGDRAAGDESRRDAGHRAQHRPAGPEFGSRLDDLTPSFSDDIYWSNAGELHGHGIPADRKAIATIRTARGNPDAVVTIYRAVPKDAGDAIQAGDWVTLTREYAKDHGDGPLDGDYKIISAKVPAGSLFNEGNSIHEFGYHPNDSTALDSPSAPDDSGRNFDQPSRYTFNESDYRPQVVSWAKDRFGDDIAPNGKPAWQNFVRWFGDSKVVDERGNPLVVYHGTGADITEFRAGLRRDGAVSSVDGGHGFYFTPNPDLASKYATRDAGNVVPAYVSIRNPMPPEVENGGLPIGVGGYNPDALFPGGFIGARDEIERALAAGYDGIIRGDEIIAFRPEQIKSAIGNNGDFDADNADIRYSRIAARVSQGVKQASPQKLGAMLNAKLHANILANTGKTGQFIADQIDDGFVRDWVDEFIDLTRAEEATAEKLGIKPEELPEHLQARRRENLRHGAYQDALQQAEKDHFEPVAKILGDADLSREGLADYLWWRHAGERDAYLRQKDGTNAGPADLAGIDPAEAARNIEALPAKERAAYEKAAAHIDALRKRTLDVLVDSGQIREEVRDSLLSRWQHYVPLRGMPAHMDDPIIASFQGVGKGLSVKRNPLGKKALGRKSKPSDILEEMHMDLQRALIGAEKQRVLKRIIGLVQANPDLGAVDPVKTEKSEVNGVITYVQTSGDPQTQLTYLHKGQPVRIELADPELTRAVLDMNEPLPDALRKLGKATRWLSSVKTALSPYFMLINPIRDAGFAAMGLSAEHGGAMLKDAATFYPQTFNAMRRDANGSPLNKDIDRYAREFAMGGGKTGYTFVNDIDGVRKDLNRMFLKERKGLSPLKVWNKVSDLVEAANGYAENSTRLAVFAAARKNGMTIEQAAKYAKEITVNFNTKGRLGKNANVAYMFFNAAVQGTRRFNTLMKNRSFQAMMVGMVGTSYALALAQMIAMGDDDDDESLYLKKIKDTDRLRSLPISVGDEEWLSIPVPYGPNFMNYLGSKMAEVTYETMRGRKVKPGKVIGQIFSAASQSFSPIDVGDGWAALSPEVLRVGYNFVNNKDDWGRPLNYTAHYDNEGKKPLFKEGNVETGQAFKAMAWALNRLTGGDDYTAGAANYSPEQMRYLTQQALGGLYRLGTESYELMEKMLTDDKIMPQDVPLSNVFLRSRATEKQQAEKFYENRDLVDRLADQFKDAHAADDQVKLNDLLSEHPWLAGAQLNAGSKFGKMAQAGKPMAMLRNTNNSIRKLRADRQAAFLRVGRYDGISQAESRKRMREIDAEIAELQKSFTRHVNQWERRAE